MLSTMQSLSGELHSANGDSSDLGSGASLLSPRSSINHDLPPGCSVANIPEPRQKLQGQQRSRTDGAPTLRPFSGTGHTLGSGNISQVNHRPSATVTSENQILESNNNCQGDRSRSGTGRSDFQGPQAETINRNPWRDMKSVAVSDTSKRNSLDVNERNRDKNLCPAVSHPVLNNATFETSNSTLNDGNVPNVDKYVGREDFIDSQNEDRVLQEVSMANLHVHLRNEFHFLRFIKVKTTLSPFEVHVNFASNPLEFTLEYIYNQNLHEKTYTVKTLNIGTP